MSILNDLGLVPLIVALFFGASLDDATAAERVFVPLGSDDTILVIDAKTDEVVGELTGVPAVHGLAGTPDGRFLVAGSYNEYPLDDDGTIEAIESSGDDHLEHHYAPSDNGPEADPVFSTVSILQSFDGDVVNKIDVPGAVHHVAVSPDGRTAVVTHPFGGRISAIDLKGAEVTAIVDTGLMPNYAVFAQGGDSVFVTNAGDGTVAEIDTSQWVVVREIRVGDSPEHLVMSPDGNRLYVNNVNDGTVSVIDVAAGIVVKTIVVGPAPHGIDISDDGSTLFVAVLDDNNLVAIDLSTGTQWQLNLDPQPYHLAVIEGMDKIYISSAQSPWIWVVDQASFSLIGKISIDGKGHQMVQISTK